ncbi:YbbR-like domain-containing protein [Daejeonella sp.]|uniref:CdaR family protein n=1 Tax=Daejeonella sp. TaxID=2805397 RepID=UPI00271FA704|nr:CdaR family protein [Daejeonella sp.]MDO8991504.1 CdaR family protein [Daejeonella sp.]MDP2412797.1 CdaR family protein [Daejeonella sp.]
MPLIKFTKIERRRISLFFLCLLLAVGAWLFFALSNRYVYQVQTLVRFVDLPENRAFHPLQSDTIRLQVEGTGWQLLFSKLRISPPSVNIELKELQKQTFIELSDQIQKINTQVGSTQKVVYIHPDTLYFDFSSSTVKKIPVVLKQDIQFKAQFGISDSVQISPAFVTITGPVKELANIKGWETELLSLDKVSESVNMKINLKRPSKANITIHPGFVDLRLNIDEFTEKVVEIPVKVLNNKEFRNVKLLPDKVKVTLLSPLSKYPETDRSDFELFVDLNNWKENGYTQLPVRIIRIPEFSRLVKIEPQTLDFIIQK